MNKFSRLLIAYLVAVPLALILGYLVATPDNASLAVLGFVLFFLALPLVIEWNHALLIVCWNSAFILGFLPGQPSLWLVVAALTFGIAALNHLTGLQSFVRAPALAKPILFLLAVIVATGWFRGGLGSKILGGAAYGGRNYVYALGAVIGYFALTSKRISPGKSESAAKWFFLSGTTSVLSNVIYALGPAFYVLYYFVSAETAGSQAASDWGQNTVERFSGLNPAAIGLLCFILARWGLRRMFEWHKPWRLFLLLAALTAGLFSGFRSGIAFLCVLLAVQSMVEGLWKTAFLPRILLAGLLGLAPILIFANKLPFAVQRSLAAFEVLVPVNINPDVRAEAAASTEWRYEMWRVVWPEVPKYLLLGKGYSIDPTEQYLIDTAARTGLISRYEEAMLAGDYHSGPLSVLIPFGGVGAIAFLWMLGAGIKALYSNLRYGETRLRLVNMALFSYFLTQCLFFFFVFGAFNSELYVFLGILGVSVSLNGGVRHKEALKSVAAPGASVIALQPA
jgi:hypothetical protein